MAKSKLPINSMVIVQFADGECLPEGTMLIHIEVNRDKGFPKKVMRKANHLLPSSEKNRQEACGVNGGSSHLEFQIYPLVS